MHLDRVTLLTNNYPTVEYYPFNLEIFRKTGSIEFRKPVTFFMGENGTGKSTILEAISYRCGIHIWETSVGPRFESNPYEKRLCDFIRVEWLDDPVPGSFFSGEMFRDFSRLLDVWSVKDPGMLEYFGGRSLLSQSHGQSLMSFFRNRYQIKGLYLLDEPETALSPKSQLALLSLLNEMGKEGHAQFIIASHSPILLACPGAQILSFDEIPVKQVEYEETEVFRVYSSFMKDRARFL
ncbi:AAA family ATPase [Thermodesulfobacteriota bacterium]